MYSNRLFQKLQPSKYSAFSSQRGSAIVEFVLVGAPLVLTALTVLSLLLSSFSLLVLRDSAIEGARYAALADQDSSTGCTRAKKLAESAIGRITSISSSCRQIPGLIEVVELRALIPLLGFMATSREFTVRGSAPIEN